LNLLPVAVDAKNLRLVISLRQRHEPVAINAAHQVDVVFCGRVHHILPALVGERQVAFDVPAPQRIVGRQVVVR